MSNIIVNHLLFADDAVIFAPSAKGLQQLLDICSEFAARLLIILYSMLRNHNVLGLLLPLKIM